MCQEQLGDEFDMWLIKPNVSPSQSGFWETCQWPGLHLFMGMMTLHKQFDKQRKVRGKENICQFPKSQYYNRGLVKDTKPWILGSLTKSLLMLCNVLELELHTWPKMRLKITEVLNEVLFHHAEGQ